MEEAIANKPMDVEQLRCKMLRRMPMRERFRLPMSTEEAYQCLRMTVELEVTSRHRKYDEYDETKQILMRIAQWLTTEHTTFSLLLCGGCGNGKTTIMRAIARLINTLEIRIPGMNDGSPCYQLPFTDAKILANKAKTDEQSFEKWTSKEMLGIDDLGTEPLEIMNYGNIISPIVDLLTHRYNNQLFTIITTNLTPQQIRERYGTRIADRLNEMAEKIVFKNTTYRI